MVLLHAWQRDERGHLRRRTFDHAAIPPGWYDAPDKVPAPLSPESPSVPSEQAPAAARLVTTGRRRGRPRKV